MKKFFLFPFAFLCILSLAACTEGTDFPLTASDASYLGKYECLRITMDTLTMNPEGKWLELKADGTMTTFLTEEPDEAEWRLSGENFTMIVAGKTVGSGKLTGTQLVLDMMGMEYTFVQEGTDTDQSEQNASEKTYATFFCYGNLYAVRYATEQFHQDPAGLSDLYSDDGVKGWITKLDTKERVAEWLSGFEEKAVSETVQDCRSIDLTVAGHPAQAIVYQDDANWHSEVIVNFGKDMGDDTYPMYAAYIYFTGDTYGSVWNEGIQSLIDSLSLNDPT